MLESMRKFRKLFTLKENIFTSSSITAQEGITLKENIFTSSSITAQEGITLKENIFTSSSITAQGGIQTFLSIKSGNDSSQTS